MAGARIGHLARRLNRAQHLDWATSGGLARGRTARIFRSKLDQPNHGFSHVTFRPRSLIAAPLIDVTGIVFNDANGNGVRDAGERGVPNVVVSDQRDVVVTDVNGAFKLPGADSKAVVFVSVPDGWRAV